MTATIENVLTEQLLSSIPAGEMSRIAEKVIERQRLTSDDGLFLFETEHADAVQKLADYARKVCCGDAVYYASTLFIHPTNLCELSCPFCSYYAKPGWDSAWMMTPEDIENKVKEFYPKKLTEIHFVGGLWHECDLNYFQDAFQRIKAIDPDLHIKALTAVEYDFLARLHNIPVEEVFERMISWGLESLPGGGAEILVEGIRKQIAPQKINSDRYVEVHKIAHKMGLRSNITVLFGHIEDNADIVEHLCVTRELQDETNGLQTFVPLKYHDENNALGKRKKRLKSKDIYRVYAVSRLMLDNVRNLKVLWNYTGLETGQELLRWGANDFASTALDEKIIVMAGGVEMVMTRENMRALITKMGRIPKEINSAHDYNSEVLSIC
jgi:aminodeoxyfutalosine synthase